MTEKYLFSTRQSPTIGRPNAITWDRFDQLLKTKNSPALVSSKDIYDTLYGANIDTSFALAQFRLESQYGTAGHALVTKSWGNMLWDANLTTRAVDKYIPPNGYIYAVYDNWVSAIEDYVVYLNDYATRRHLVSIYDAMAEWIGEEPGSDFHLFYVDTILWDMARYEWPTVTFQETGDELIDASKSFDNNTGQILTRYPLKKGTVLYKGTSGKILTTYQGNDTEVWFLGLVNNSRAWGQVKVQSSGSPKFVYIKNIDLNAIKVVT